MAFSRAKKFFYSCLCIIIGVAIASFLPKYLLAGALWWFVAMVVSLVIFFFIWLNQPDKQRKIHWLLLFLAFLFFGIWRYSLSLPSDTPDQLWHYNGQTLTFIGVVKSVPDIRLNNIRLEVKAEAFANLQKKITGKVLLVAGLFPVYNYGDELEITCRLERPQEFQGFAYDRYLARYDIYSICYRPEIKLIATGQGNKIYSLIYQTKNYLAAAMSRGLGEPEASLAKGILLGDKKGLNQELLDSFSHTGLTHIMAVSGMNVTLLTVLTMNFCLLVGLTRRQAFYLAISLLIIFIIMVGAPASAVRAGIMGLLLLMAEYLGRLNKVSRMVIFAGALMLIFNPKLLRDDVGWQLSFLAIIGLLYGYPLIERGLEKIKIPELKGLRTIMSMTLAAQIFTLPVTAYNFSTLSLVAPLANVLVIWSIAWLTALIILGIFLSLLFASWSVVFFFPAALMLKYIIGVARWLSSLPFSFININYISIFWLLFYYLVISMFLYYIKTRTKDIFLFNFGF